MFVVSRQPRRADAGYGQALPGGELAALPVVHLMRNLLARTGESPCDVARRRLLAERPDMAEARRRLAELSQASGKSVSKAVACLEVDRGRDGGHGPHPRSTRKRPRSN